MVVFHFQILHFWTKLSQQEEVFQTIFRRPKIGETVSGRRRHCQAVLCYEISQIRGSIQKVQGDRVGQALHLDLCHHQTRDDQNCRVHRPDRDHPATNTHSYTYQTLTALRPNEHCDLYNNTVTVSSKNEPLLFFNNSVKRWPILLAFWHATSRRNPTEMAVIWAFSP